jgi:signal transduction histidine kinase
MNREVDTQTIDLLTPETLAQLENHVQYRLGGQVHDFRLRVRNGGLILVGRAAMPQRGRLSLCGHPVPEGVEVVVTDTGGGIAPENLSRVMEPSYSAKARGLGLGLALAKAIVEKHKGNLRAASQPGQGSTFTVRLMAEAVTKKENDA